MARRVMFSQVIIDLVDTVADAAKIVRRTLRKGVHSNIKEFVPGGSHHSISTEADQLSQEYLLGRLRRQYPNSLFLAEEDCTGDDLIVDDSRHLIWVPDRQVFILDSLDGTAGAYRHRWDWSVCGNLFRGGQPVGGTIFAPDARNGLEVVGENEVGVFLREGRMRSYRQVSISEREIRKSTVLFGVDVLKRRQYLTFTNNVANCVETAVVAGSCALGVATVACGKAEAIVQPHQWPWDWSTAATLIPVAGGKVIWYHYRSGRLVRLEVPDVSAFSRTNRTDFGGLGFIAGSPDLVDWLWEQLQENWIE